MVLEGLFEEPVMFSVGPQCVYLCLSPHETGVTAGSAFNSWYPQGPENT